MNVKSAKCYVQTVGEGKGEQNWALEATLRKVVRVGLAEKVT